MGNLDAFYVDLLDTSNEDDVREYEEAFYNAYLRVPGRNAVAELWNLDEEAHRISTKIGYEEQMVYCLRRKQDSTILTAMAVNYAMRQYQASRYQFEPPTGYGRVCEVLSLIAVEEFNLPTRFAFRNAVFRDMHSRGFQIAVSTAATRVVRFYERMGATILKTIPLVGRDLHLIFFDLEEARWRDEKHSLSSVGIQPNSHTHIHDMELVA